MHKIKKFIIPILSLALIVVSVFSIYTNHKLQRFKESCENIIQGSLKTFAAYAATKEEYDEYDYAVLYSNLETASNTLLTLITSNYVVKESPNENLLSVIGKLRAFIENEREEEAISTLFSKDSEAFELLYYKVAEDMYDVDSTDKLLELLEAYEPLQE